MSHTLAQAAELTARHMSDPDAAYPYLLAQYRRFATRGVVTPIGHKGFGRTATALIDERGLATARLASEMVQKGLSLEAVYAASRCLDNGPGFKGFADVLDAIRGGEQAFLCVRFEVVGDISGGFRRQADLADFFNYPMPWSATIVLDATLLLKPLLQHAIADDDLGPDDAKAAAEPEAPRPRKRQDVAVARTSFSSTAQGECHAP